MMEHLDLCLYDDSDDLEDFEEETDVQTLGIFDFDYPVRLVGAVRAVLVMMGLKAGMKERHWYQLWLVMIARDGDVRGVRGGHVVAAEQYVGWQKQKKNDQDDQGDQDQEEKCVNKQVVVLMITGWRVYVNVGVNKEEHWM